MTKRLKTPTAARVAKAPARSARKPASGAVEDDVRARVLEAAVQMIDEGGLASLSMREVARRAGVSHQAPYHYFPDRESILAAVAEEGFILLEQQLDRLRDAGGRAADRLARSGETYVRFAYEHPAHFRVMFRPDFVDMGRFPNARECGQKAFQSLIEVVHACRAEGLRAEPSEQAVIVLGWSVVHGLACLLLDGCLDLKLPEETAAIAQGGLEPGSKTIVSDVMEALRALVLAGSAPPVPTRSRRKV